MIFPLLSLLLTTSVTAQVTTSIALFKNNLGTDKLGFYGSVINVSGTNTTLAVTYDNGTNTKALGLANRPQTFTVGPSMFEVRTNLTYGRNGSEGYILHCDLPASADPACTVSYDPALARGILCPASARTTGTSYTTLLNTYSGRGSYSAGVETITRTFIYGSNQTTRASWCSDRSFIPSSGYVSSVSLKKENIGTYQVVITAGQEKLSATQGASGSGASATSTAAVSSTGSTGAAVPVKTVGPAVLGLGAFAAFLL